MAALVCPKLDTRGYFTDRRSMMLSPFTYYLAHIGSIAILANYLGVRLPILRFYAGALLSMMGCLTLMGYSFPADTILQFLRMMQAIFAIDSLTTGSPTMWKFAGFYVCAALTNTPDIYYAPSLGIYAIAPTYYVLGSIVPAIYWTTLQGFFHGFQIVGALYYLSRIPIPIYMASIHLIFLTISVYMSGLWISRLHAV